MKHQAIAFPPGDGRLPQPSSGLACFGAGRRSGGALRRQRRQPRPQRVADGTARELPRHHQFAELAPVTVRRRAIADQQSSEPAVLQDVVRVVNVTSALEAPDSALVVMDLEGLVREIVRAAAGRATSGIMTNTTNTSTTLTTAPPWVFPGTRRPEHPARRRRGRGWCGSPAAACASPGPVAA